MHVSGISPAARSPRTDPMWKPPSPQRILVIVLLSQATAVLGLLLFMAITGRVLVVELASRDELRTVEASSALIIPVAGVRAAELRDSYGDPRAGGRTHDGIDILAPEGTPVVAAATGVIVGRDTVGAGGIALYLRELDQRTVHYYAHLQRYRAGLKEGDLVRQGETIAHVGSTGNVSGSAHLHFSVHTVPEPNAFRRGRVVPPCELLPCGGEAGAS
jgi:peptidoglycan LD-endopeptidase LytH